MLTRSSPSAAPQMEMRTQDLQLAQTLLGLSSEIQRLRRESFGGVDPEGDEQQ